MAYIGRACGFSQRLCDGTDSPYCSDEASHGPQRVIKSPVKLGLLREDIRSYDGPSPPRPVDEQLNTAIKLAYDAFSLPAPINPIHLNDFPRAEWDKWHTSPGLPWKNMGLKDKFSVAKDIRNYKWVRCYWHKIKDGKRKPPFDCDAYLESFPVEEGKVRVIWGYPATTAFQEACFGIPLNRECKKLASPVMYDNDNIKDEIQNIHARLEKEKNFMGFEYENFEKTVPGWVIRIAFDILLKNLDLSKYADRGIPDPDKLLNAYKYAVYYFINTPIRLSNGERYRKRKGIPNGSSFAQLIGSMANYIISAYALLKSGNEIKDMLVCGNCILASTSLPVNVEVFVSLVTKCGLQIDACKIETGSDVNKMKFLGFTINKEKVSEDVLANISGENSVCLASAEAEAPSEEPPYVSNPDCCHRSYRTSLVPFSYFHNHYGYLTNTDFEFQHNTFLYHFPYFAEMNYLPYYVTPLLLPSNL